MRAGFPGFMTAVVPAPVEEDIEEITDGALLLEDGSSFLLLEDGTSKLLLE